MADNIKCPFCQGPIMASNEFICICKNSKCPTFAIGYPKFILQALIDGKAAQDALEDVKEDINSIIAEWNSRKGIGETTRRMCALACQARDKIASITPRKDE